jgi:uncharacterized protein (TIGR03083 family)
MPPSQERYFAEIQESTETLARLVDGADLARQVPTCPEWTLRKLATHVGRAQRWAAQITATRSAEMIPFRAVPDGALPADPAQHAPWLRAGARLLVGALAEAGDDQVWAFDGLRPATFWARRMAHETAVHRADAQITLGRRPDLAADLAADAIDEWLGFLSGQRLDGSPDRRLDALAGGRVLHVHATDDGLGGGGEWLVRGDQAAVTVEHGHGRADVALRGPAAGLLLVLLRRAGPDDPAVEVTGDAALLARWLQQTPF